jgi:hypothetical protein
MGMKNSLLFGFSIEQGPFLVTGWAKVENLARKWPEVRMSTIMATYSNNTLGPIGTFSKMLKAVKDSLRWTCVGLVLG